MLCNVVFAVDCALLTTCRFGSNFASAESDLPCVALDAIAWARLPPGSISTVELDLPKYLVAEPWSVLSAIVIAAFVITFPSGVKFAIPTSTFTTAFPAVSFFCCWTADLDVTTGALDWDLLCFPPIIYFT